VLKAKHISQIKTPGEEFLLYCGVAAVRDGELFAPCGLFNDWYSQYIGATIANSRGKPSRTRVATASIRIPAEVADAYRRGRLVLFVGSGLSPSRGVAGNFPTWRDLPLRFLDACERYEALETKVIQAKRVTFEGILRLELMLRELDVLVSALRNHYQQVLNRYYPQ
jgi:hypothetical protein